MDTTFKSYDSMTPRERLTFLEDEPNLQYTCARWLTHEAVYPGLGAAYMARDLVEREAREIEELRPAVAEFEQKMLGDDATEYMQFLLATREAALAAAAAIPRVA
jgi:hypothetical protein